MSGLLEQAVVQALSDYLTPLVRAQVPRFASGTVKVGWQDYADPISYPDVVVIAQRFKHQPYQEQEEDDTVSGSLLVSVGEMVGTVEVRAYDNTSYGRRLLEGAVTEAMLSTEGAPGVVSLTTAPVVVGGKTWTSGSLCSFQMDDAEWREEMVFSGRRYSYLHLDAQYPALYARSGVYSIDNLQAYVSAATTEDVSTSSFVSGSDGVIEALTVNPSGSATDFS